MPFIHLVRTALVRLSLIIKVSLKIRRDLFIQLNGVDMLFCLYEIFRFLEESYFSVYLIAS